MKNKTKNKPIIHKILYSLFFGGIIAYFGYGIYFTLTNMSFLTPFLIFGEIMAIIILMLGWIGVISPDDGKCDLNCSECDGTKSNNCVVNYVIHAQNDKSQNSSHRKRDDEEKLSPHLGTQI